MSMKCIHSQRRIYTSFQTPRTQSQVLVSNSFFFPLLSRVRLKKKPESVSSALIFFFAPLFSLLPNQEIELGVSLSNESVYLFIRAKDFFFPPPLEFLSSMAYNTFQRRPWKRQRCFGVPFLRKRTLRRRMPQIRLFCLFFLHVN